MGLMATIGSWFRPSAATEVQGTRWRGASHSLRSLQGWNASIGSPRSDLPATEQRTLRARSRDAFRGHMVARAALTRPRTNIVGTGLMCRPSIDASVLGLSAEEAEALNAKIMARYEAWAEDPNECDIEATSDIYGLQGLALLSSMASGDVFALTPFEVRQGGVTGLKIQLVEADRISNPMDTQDTDTCVDGIEIRGSRPIGCWIRNTHPGDRFSVVMPSWTYYDMFGGITGRRRVLHVWNDKERPSQVRGAPYLAPILEPLKQIERYGNAELMAAVISAMLTVFIKKDAELTDKDGNPVHSMAGEEGAGQPPAALDGSGTLSLGNGAIVDLAPGEEPHAVNPSRPNANFDPFFMAVVKQIGAALELPVDELLLHYQSSYSAARAAMLQAWRFYTLRRWVLVQQFCQPIYNLFIDEEVAAGRLRLPGYADPIKRRAYTRALWIGPARGAMDELKEAQAAKTRIEAGISNETIETAAMAGEDRDAVYARRLREINQRKADGTFFPPSGTARPAENADQREGTTA
jgi:lambda family phage portal protein